MRMEGGERMNIKNIENRIAVLHEAEEKLEVALFHIAQADNAMPADMAFSHHAEMELQENLAQVQEAIQDIADRLAAVGVEI